VESASIAVVSLDLLTDTLNDSWEIIYFKLSKNSGHRAGSRNGSLDARQR